jgi:predicted DNA-binding protein (MmcQ/YjbR family)
LAIGLEQLKDYCGRKPGSHAGSPFGEGNLVFKVCGRIFASLHVKESPVKITLKTDPELAGLLRQTYPAVRPARYFDKRYWSAVTCDGDLPEDELLELIDTSYDLVVRGLKKSDRASLRELDPR